MAFTIASNVAAKAAAAPGRRVAPKRNVAVRAAAKGFEMPEQYKKIAPTADRVLVKVAEAEKTTAGGIILAETAQRKPTSGTSEPSSLSASSS
jgi:chaperonin GroES